MRLMLMMIDLTMRRILVSSVLLLLCWMKDGGGRCWALQCPPLSECDPSTHCDRSQLSRCAGGIVKDVCGCCDTCAKVENETCGGLHGLKGECDEGLICVYVHSKVYPPFGDEEGICQARPKECQGVKCHPILPSCPADSLPSLDIVSTSADRCCPQLPKCRCNPDACRAQACDAEHEPRLLRAATDTPGECCDVYECLYSGPDCSSVTCPPTSSECPADSYALPNVRKPEWCCAKSQGCACLPDSCPPVECPDNQRLKVLVYGNGRPGSCCTLFHCIKEGEQTCLYEGEEYVEGSTWKVDKCTSCSCKGNITFCNSVECNVTSYCGRMEVPEGECCPVCTGCISSSGAFFANGATWQKDDCTACACVDGEVHCQAEFCTVECSNPKKIPGVCCPHCADGPSVVTLPPHCPSLDNCTKICTQGYQRDERNCYTCDCRLDDCPLRCEHGYETDDRGLALCRCRCPPLDGCDKQCLHGFRFDGVSSTCRVCKCAKCRSLKCSKDCPYGHVLNDRGCKTCKCANQTTRVDTRPGDDDPEDVSEATVGGADVTATEIESETGSPPSPAATEYCFVDGTVRDDGEFWDDGCRHCYCHGSKEMCSLIQCPSLACEHPVLVRGDCCPRCPGDGAMARNGSTTVCQAVDGVLRVEGETWNVDSCTQCVCHGGQALCHRRRCPPAACQNPVVGPDGCCPACLASTTMTTGPRGGSGLSCTSDGRRVDTGDTWRVGDCQSCRCSDGEIRCYFERCPALACDRPVLTKGHCCPFCLTGETLLPSCIFEGVPYVNGEVWRENECSLCQCVDGKIICKVKECPEVDCGRTTVAIKKPGECCASCPDVTVKVPDYHFPASQTFTIILWVSGLILALLLMAITFCCLRSRCRCYSMQKKSVPCFQTDSDFDQRLELNNRGCYKSTQPYQAVQCPLKSGT